MVNNNLRQYSKFLVSLSCSLVLAACSEDDAPNCPASFMITTSSVTDASCGADNGIIDVLASGMQGAVSYQIDGGSVQTAPTFSELASGTYLIEATDAEGCVASLTATVGNTDATILAQLSTAGTVCGEAQGMISIDASGGSEPYAYSIDGEGFQAENTFVGLETGAYNITVRDNNGCSLELMTSIQGDVSFSASISDIVANNCALSGCHVAGRGIPDFTDKENILTNANAIKNRTVSGSMPPASSGRTLSDAQIEAIACWVDSGAPDN